MVEFLTPYMNKMAGKSLEILVAELSLVNFYLS